MADSDTAICNSALLKVGAERINALTEQNERAVVCDEQYPKIRRLLIRSHPWNFALERRELAELATTPLFEYEKEFGIPLDVLSILKFEDEDNRLNKFKVEGRKVLTNNGTVKCLCLINVTDVSLFDANFDEAFAWRLAAEIAWPLVQSATLAKNMLDAFNLFMREARSLDAQEGTPDDFEAEEWIDSRRGPSRF